MRSDKIRNKKNILKKTLEYIGNHDIESVSFEEIATASEVTRATLYNHFSSKEELLKEMVIPALEYITHDLEEINKKEVIHFSDVTSSLLRLYKKHKKTIELAGCNTLSQNIDVRNSHMKFLVEFKKLMISACPQGYPLGLDKSMKIISRIYIPILITLHSSEDLHIPNLIENQFYKIIKGALCL